MKSLTVKKIPKWLIDSELAKSFIETGDDEEIFQVPKEFFKKKPTIDSVEDFVRIYKTGHFWDLKTYPKIFYDYFENNRETVFSTISYLYNIKKDGKLEYLYNDLKQSLLYLEYDITYSNMSGTPFEKNYLLNINLFGKVVFSLKFKLTGAGEFISLNNERFTLNSSNDKINDFNKLINSIQNGKNFNLKVRSSGEHESGIQISTYDNNLLFKYYPRTIIFGDLYVTTIPINKYTKSNIVDVLQSFRNNMATTARNILTLESNL